MQDKTLPNSKNTEKLLQISKMYYDICFKSSYNNHWGVSVKYLKNQYNLRKRDISVLLKFFDTYYNNYDSISLEYLIYRFPDNRRIPSEEIKFEELDENLYEEIFYEEDINDDCFIRIKDDITIIQEKISSADVDLTNVSFIEGISNNIYSIWNNVSNAKLNPDYIVNKKSKIDIPEHMPENKRKWVQAVTSLSFVEMDYCSDAEKKTVSAKVLPVGMYYDKFLEKYILVYTIDKKNYLDIEIDNVKKISIINEIYEIKPTFNINEYIKSMQTERVVLKVFHEAKAANKLKDLLSENQLHVKENDTYDILEFMTRNPQQYVRVINGFGMSVVVQEPAYIKDSILNTAKKALSYYETRFLNE